MFDQAFSQTQVHRIRFTYISGNMRKTTPEAWKIIHEEPLKPYLTHCIYESEKTDFAFYFSQIEEIEFI